jgi:hypothetical protein
MGEKQETMLNKNRNSEKLFESIPGFLIEPAEIEFDLQVDLLQ